MHQKEIPFPFYYLITLNRREHFGKVLSKTSKPLVLSSDFKIYVMVLPSSFYTFMLKQFLQVFYILTEFNMCSNNTNVTFYRSREN